MNHQGDEGVCESQLFSEGGLIRVMSDAIEYFKKVSPNLRKTFSCDPHNHLTAPHLIIIVIIVIIIIFFQGALYETGASVYKLMMPIHEARRDYRQLARCHADLQDICNDIANAVHTHRFPLRLLCSQLLLYLT